MNQSREFDIVLSSDFNKDDFPKNNPSSFRNKLSKKLNLQGSWYVSLLEISVPKTWVSSRTISFHLVDETTSQQIGEERSVELLTTDEYTDITAKLNNAAKLDGLDSQVTFGSDKNGKLTITNGVKKQDYVQSIIAPVFDEYSKEILGLYIVTTLKNKKVIAYRPPNLYDYADIFTVESDLIEPIHVGSDERPVLRYLIPKGLPDFGDNLSFNFAKPQKRKIKVSYIESIDINISNLKGVPPPFRFGTSVLTLRFQHDPYY